MQLKLAKMPVCYKSALSKVTKVPQQRFKSDLLLQKLPNALKKFCFFVTIEPVPLALCHCLATSSLPSQNISSRGTVDILTAPWKNDCENTTSPNNLYRP